MGEFVEVTLTSSLEARSRVQEVESEVFLGVCLKPGWVAGLDNCDAVEPPVIDFEPSDAFTIKSGDTIVRAINVDVKRNSVKDLSHTFSLTANRAGTVTLIGRLESYDNPEIFGQASSIGPEQAVVTFR